MHKIYHLSSAQDIGTDLLDAIRASFKSKPITIIVAEDDANAELTEDMKALLDDRLEEDETTYISAADSINSLIRKYGL